MIWTLTSDNSQRAVRTAGTEQLTHYGRRVVLLAQSNDGLDGVFVASNCKFTIGGHPCASIDLFVWHGKGSPAEAISQAVAATRHIFGKIVGGGIAVHGGDANATHRQAFLNAGFNLIGNTCDSDEVLGMAESDMPPPLPPANCQLGLYGETYA